MRGPIIGIDLGTTKSAVAVVEDGAPEIILNSEGDRTIPSVISFSDTGEPLVGKAAKKGAVQNPDRTVESLNHHIGDEEYTVEINGDSYTPEQLLTLLVEKIKRDAESHLDEPVDGAVGTIPDDASYTAIRRLVSALEGADLEVEGVVTNTTAASVAYGVTQDSHKTILVYDLGGGTFDVSVVDLGGGLYDRLAANGDVDLGGDDWDGAIVDWLVQTLETEHDITIGEDQQVLKRLKDAAEKAKRALSSRTETKITVPYLIFDDDEPIHLETTLSRERFESLTSDLLERTIEPTEQVIEDAGIDSSAIDEVLLVGDATRMPQVQERIEDLLGIYPRRATNQNESVALGAAIRGGFVTDPADDAVLLEGLLKPVFIEVGERPPERIFEQRAMMPAETTISIPDRGDSIPVRLYRGDPADADEQIDGCELIGSVEIEQFDDHSELTVRIPRYGLVELEYAGTVMIIEPGETPRDGAFNPEADRSPNSQPEEVPETQTESGSSLSTADRDPTETELELLVRVCNDLQRALEVTEGDTETVQSGVSTVRSSLARITEEDIPSSIVDHIDALIDDIDRATSTSPQDGEDLQQWISIARQRAEHALNAAGVTLVDPSTGASFDPHRHNVTATTDADLPADRIVSVEEIGYEFDGQIQRPAKVLVSTGEDQPGSESDGPDEQEPSDQADTTDTVAEDGREDSSGQADDEHSIDSVQQEAASDTIGITGDRLGGPWPMGKATPARTGHSDTATAPEFPFQRRWQYETSLIVESSPVVVDGTVYVGADDRTIHAIDASSGEPRWRVDTTELVWSSPAVLDGTVYVGDTGGQFYAIDAETGRVAWTWECVARIQSSPVPVGTTVYFGCDDYHVYAMDAASGSKRWGYRTGSPIETDIAVAGTMVYATNQDGVLTALDGADGSLQWQVDVGDDVTGPAVMDSRVFVGTSDGAMCAYDRSNGDQLWRESQSATGTSPPAVADDWLFVGAGESVVAQDPTSGEPIWETSLGGTVTASPSITESGVCVCTDAGGLHWLDKTDGEQLYSCTTDGAIHTAPAIGNGAVYVGCWDCSVYAFTAEDE